MKTLILSWLFVFPLMIAAQVPPGFIAQYPLDNTATDISGNSYNGSLASTSGTTNRFNVANQATQFVAGSSTGQLPGTLQTAIRNSFSLGFWFNTSMIAPTAGPWYGGNAMVDAEMCGVTSDWGIALIDGGNLAFGIGVADNTIKTPLDYNDGAWHFVTAIRNGSTGSFALYVDGNQVVTGTGTTSNLVAPTFIGLGRNPCVATAKYTGKLDDIVVYDRVLNNTEIQNLYNFSLQFTLPLKWVRFSGFEKDKQIILQWTVANMINVKQFEVEASEDGQYFTRIGAVPATAGISEYAYQTSDKAQSGSNYFRIRQLDYDGTFNYSDVVIVRTGPELNNMSIVSSLGRQVISINNPNQQMIHRVNVYDVAGRNIIVQQSRSSNTVLDVDISKLKPGHYFISVVTDKEKSVFPFLK